MLKLVKQINIGNIDSTVLIIFSLYTDLMKGNSILQQVNRYVL